MNDAVSSLRPCSLRRRPERWFFNAHWSRAASADLSRGSRLLLVRLTFMAGDV